MEVRCWISIRN